ncbi:hypothetical protein Riv7116_6333 [Rivularia sp. PCC 7116]|uniref:DUF5837 family cyanobactin class RiPP n=1 Tax=Rivularia sp. PCC 7116 TaxID=373994 RepID=UPI00029EE901|nr:DUF5837 family cyanobactin class RiPP [Rivularia sp. PCC 7116]AFY58675.1 hypothetical protein Riv7116_6333 [Rivularia sp. PCC 7116]
MNKKNLNPLQTKPAIRASMGTRIQADLVTELTEAGICGDEINASFGNFYNPYILRSTSAV